MQVSPTLRAGGNKTGGDRPPGTDVDTCETLIPMYQTAHTLRGEGFDASEDGTGRGTPLVPVAFNFHKSGNEGSSLGVTEDRTDCLRADSKSPFAVAFDCKSSGQNGFGIGEVAATLRSMGHANSHTNGGGHAAVQQGTAVRRLTPRECERLQGFSDNFTLIPVRGKPAADGPRYKALGNSMAVPCMAWIGKRIAAVAAIKGAEVAA